MDLLIYQIANTILVGFPWTVFLDPLIKYYSSYPTPLGNFGLWTPLPALEFPVTPHGGWGGWLWIFSGTTHFSRASPTNLGVGRFDNLIGGGGVSMFQLDQDVTKS